MRWESRSSKVHAKLKNRNCFANEGIEHVSRKLPFFVGKTNQEAALDAERGLVGLGMLRHPAHAKPSQR